MARLAGRLARFSRDFDFVARRETVVNGKQVNAGEPIDKSKFTTRRLRQLYEWRHIVRAMLLPKQSADVVQMAVPTEQTPPDNLVQFVPKRRGRPPKPRAD